ncbi:MAG: phosphohistidine phosphatase SixA [Verrucomicrobiota bacterium]
MILDLLLLRHATAEDHGLKPDADRALTEKGQRQGRRVARFLQAHHLRPDLVLSSPIRRAFETAERVCQELQLARPVSEPWLTAGVAGREFLQEIQAYRELPCLLVVGHEPDLSALIGHLLGGSAFSVRLKKASLAHLRGEMRRAGSATLQSLVPCAYLPPETSH